MRKARMAEVSFSGRSISMGLPLWSHTHFYTGGDVLPTLCSSLFRNVSRHCNSTSRQRLITNLFVIHKDVRSLRK